MKIATSKTREQYPLSRKKILKKTISSTIAYIIALLVVYGIIAFVLNMGSEEFRGYIGPVSMWTIVFLLLIFLLTYLYQRWYYAVYFYDLTDDYIIIRKDPITPREITIPYERIQDVYMDQDLLDRMFGLYDVHLSSATISSGMEAHIDGVEKQSADGLRGILLKIVQERISKNRIVNTPVNNPQI